MPASTRMRVEELATSAQLPRLPEASIETLTPMACKHILSSCGSRVTFVASHFAESAPNHVGADPLVRPERNERLAPATALSLSALQVIEYLAHHRAAISSCDSGQKCKKRPVHLSA